MTPTRLPDSFDVYAMLCMEVAMIGAVLTGILAGAALALHSHLFGPHAGSDSLWETLYIMPFAMLTFAFFGIIAAMISLPAALAAGWPVWRRLSGQPLRRRLWATTAAWVLGAGCFLALPSLIWGWLDGFAAPMGFAAMLTPGGLLGGLFARRLYHSLLTDLPPQATQ